MTEVNTPDGKIQTDLPAEAVADLEVKPAEPAKPEPAPAAPETPKPEEPKPAEPAKPADPPAKELEPPKRKATPIANLLAKNHELEVQLETERTARAAAESKLNQPKPADPAAPAEPQPDDKLKAVAEKYKIAPEVLTAIADALKPGQQPNPELPQEVKDMLAERQQEKAHQAELAAFNTRVDKLATVFKDEPIATYKDKLLELAYSTEKAPDGERYCDKELSEIYFGFIKPEIDPGQPSAESSKGGSKAGGKVVDFEEIFNRDDPKEIEAMTSEEFQRYEKWLNHRQGDVPIK